MPDFQVYLDPQNLDSELQVSSEDMIEQYFKRLPLYDSLFKLSNIERFLFREGSNEPKTQVELLKRIFKCDEDDLEKARFDLLISMTSNIVGGSTNPEVIAFHYRQIYYCVAAILMYSEILEGATSYKDIGMVLLKTNSLLNRRPFSLESGADSDKIGRSIWTPDKSEQTDTALKASFLWESFQFSLVHNDKAILELARVFSVFYETNAGHKFRSEFKNNLGIELKDFWFVCIALFSGWVSTSHEADFYSFALNLESFESIFKLEKESLRIIFDLLSSDHQSLQSLQLEKINKRPEVAPENNFMFLEEKPFLKKEDQYICLSLPYFINWVFSDIVSLTSLVLKSKNKNLSSSFGGAYEEYVRNRFKEAYPLNENSFLTKRLHFVVDNKIEVSDAVLDYGDSLIFVEVKAKLRREKMKSVNPSHIKNRLKALFEIKGYKGKPQLEKRIEEFRNGITHIDGISPNEIRNFWPVIVTCRAEFPHFGDLYHFYNKVLEEENAFRPSYFRPITIIDIREFEVLGELISRGHSFLEILLERHLVENQALTFRNFLVKNYTCKEPRGLIKTQNLLLEELQERISVNRGAEDA